MSVAQPMIDYFKTIEEKPKDLIISLRTFRRILRYHQPYLFLIIVITILSALRAYLFLLEPMYTSQIIDQVITPRNLTPLYGLLRNIMLAAAGWSITNFVVLYLNGVLAQNVVGDMRSSYYKSIQGKPFIFFDTNSVGDLTSIATTDMQFVDNFLRTWLSVLLSTIFTIIFIFAMLYAVNPLLSLVAMIPMPFIFYFQARAFRLTMPLFRKMQLIIGKVGSYVQQNIVGMKNIRIFRMEKEMDEGNQEIGNRISSIWRSAPEKSRLSSCLPHPIF